VSPRCRKNQREYRRRQRDGEIVLKVKVRELEVAAALISAGRLCASDTADRAAVEHQVAAIVREWAERWR
jgi:hypothetical protein